MLDDSTFGAHEFLALIRQDDMEYERRRNMVQMSQTRQETRYEDLTRQLDQLP